MDEIEVRPGTPAPVAGHYYEVNVFGTRTGRVVEMASGETLPPAPVEHKWRLDRRR